MNSETGALPDQPEPAPELRPEDVELQNQSDAVVAALVNQARLGGGAIDVLELQSMVKLLNEQVQLMTQQLIDAKVVDELATLRALADRFKGLAGSIAATGRIIPVSRRFSPRRRH